MLKVHVLTLGCHKNVVDSEVMMGKLSAKAYQLVNTPQEADLMIINTCGFIDSAKEEAISEILSAIELKKEGILKYVVVAGCLTERYSDELLKEIPEIDAVMGVNEVREVEAIVAKVAQNIKKSDINHEEKLYTSDDERLLLSHSHTAYVKIAEGCDNRCSFCIIPFIRGKYRSRSMEDLVKEVTQLAAQGVKEINIIAQDTTEYGKDLYGERKLPELLRLLCKINGIEWVKLFYTYPHIFSDELIEVMSQESKICHYIDMPIQHIETSVLKRMNRKDTGELTRNKLSRIREAMPDAMFRTTVIVGFPGETEEEYEALKSFIEEFKFDYVGIFAYSQEEGTAAAILPDQIDEEVKQERLVELTNLQREISHRKNQQRVGKRYEVIVDEEADGGWYQYEGRLAIQALEIDGKVLISSDKTLAIGDIVIVEIEEVTDYDYVAAVVE